MCDAHSACLFVVVEDGGQRSAIPGSRAEALLHGSGALSGHAIPSEP